MKFKRNILLIILVGIIVLFFALKDDFDEIMNLLLNSNKLYIIISLIFVFISDVFKSISLKKIVVNSGYSFTFKKALSLMITANFFNGITPFSLGGQPFELFVLKKEDNIGYVDGTNILFKDFYTYQMAFILLGAICYICSSLFNMVVYSPIVIRIIRLGLIINLCVALFLIYIPHSRKENYKIVSFILNILNKFKIIKDKESIEEKINNSIIKFKKQTRETINSPKVIIKCIILNCLKIICIGIATYYCFKAIVSNISIIDTIVMTILVMIMSSFVPIPGASGGMEFSFVALFSYFVIDAKLSAIMLLWRFLTYYVPMIFGGLTFLTLKGE